MSGSINSVSRGGLSLYANLLESDSKASAETISKGPVDFKSPSTTTEPKKPQIDPAALRFQPTKRPQLSQKSRPRSSIPKTAPFEAKGQGNSLPQVVPSNSTSNSTKLVKTTLADWTADRDEDVFYGTERRQRGGRKKKKKNKEHILIQDWDDIYDPNRPNNFEEYKNSDEKIREVREWKERLYAHRTARRDSNQIDSDEESIQAPSGHLYAPPPNLDFAPPPSKISPDQSSMDKHDPIPISDVQSPPAIDDIEKLHSSSAIPSSGAITRGPVLYNLPSGSSEIPSNETNLEKDNFVEAEDNESQTEENSQRSRRPGQKKFAERLMSKYGWSKGKGLGAEETGIINPLQVKLEKRKKKSDAEGGGFRDAGNRGKIIGGKQSASTKEQDTGKFGQISELIVLNGMVNGTDLDEEVERGGDGDLIQEIGDECAEKYGRVERVYIHRTGASARVFVKFTSQLSALRAVNALEGRIFNGNTITAQFYDSEKFEAGNYELPVLDSSSQFQVSDSCYDARPSQLLAIRDTFI